MQDMLKLEGAAMAKGPTTPARRGAEGEREGGREGGAQRSGLGLGKQACAV